MKVGESDASASRWLVVRADHAEGIATTRPPLRDPVGSYSEVLDLELAVEDGLMFRDHGSGEIVPDYHEMTVRRDDEAARARVAEARAKTAEARVAEIEQQLDELAREP